MVRAIDGDALYQKFEAMDWYDNADRDLAEDLLLDMPALTPPNKWISVKEKLPILRRKNGRRTGGTDRMRKKKQLKKFADWFCSTLKLPRVKVNFINACALCARAPRFGFQVCPLFCVRR